MSNMMRGVKLGPPTGDGRSRLSLSRDCPKPGTPAPGNVRVRVSYAGVCGTDVRIGKGDFEATDGMIVGHEFCGTVDAVGEGVTSPQCGDNVVINPQGSCNTCRFCTKDQPNYCITGGLRSTIGMKRDGGWADFCEVPAQQTFKVPEGMPAKTAVLCEPLSCVLNGYKRMGEIPEDSRILIIGCGYVGILWAILFDFKGYRDVTIWEISERRRALARSLFPLYEIPGQLTEQGYKREAESSAVDGYDIAIECTGEPQAIVEAYGVMRRGGKLNVYGCHPKDKAMEGFMPADIMFKELTIIGTLLNPNMMRAAIDLVQEMTRDETTSKLLSLYNYTDGIREYDIEAYRHAIDLLGSEAMVKTVFKVHGDW